MFLECEAYLSTRARGWLDEDCPDACENQSRFPPDSSQVGIRTFMESFMLGVICYVYIHLLDWIKTSWWESPCYLISILVPFTLSNTSMVASKTSTWWGELYQKTWGMYHSRLPYKTKDCKDPYPRWVTRRIIHWLNHMWNPTEYKDTVSSTQLHK